VRVSTAKQDLDRQIDALIAAGIAPERIYLDERSRVIVERPGLRELIGYARDGDLIIVLPLERLGRTVRDTLDLVHDLSARGIGMRTLVDPITIASDEERERCGSRERDSARVSARGACDAIIERRGLIVSLLASAASVGGRGQLPHRLLEPIQPQLERVQEVLERERRLRNQVIARLLAPVDAVFDLLEGNGRILREQAAALETSARALEETAGLVKRQADLFDRTLAALREPAERAKAAAGLQRRSALTAAAREAHPSG
jgi:hypothetical protein